MTNINKILLKEIEESTFYTYLGLLKTDYKQKMILVNDSVNIENEYIRLKVHFIDIKYDDESLSPENNSNGEFSFTKKLYARCIGKKRLIEAQNWRLTYFEFIPNKKQRFKTTEWREAKSFIEYC